MRSPEYLASTVLRTHWRFHLPTPSVASPRPQTQERSCGKKSDVGKLIDQKTRKKQLFLLVICYGKEQLQKQISFKQDLYQNRMQL